MMRDLSKPAVMAMALLAASPAAAQVRGIPAPGAPIPAGAPVGPMASAPRGVPHGGAQVPTAGARVWQNGRWNALPPRGTHAGAQVQPGRWGRTVNGRWQGGAKAPGGWNAYRQLGRGGHLSKYWMGSNFRIPDYLSYGLASPPQGYFWVRYYDDAVLADGYGNVWDSVGGIGWGDEIVQGGGYADSYGDYSESYSSYGASGYGSAGAGYAAPIAPVDPNAYYGYPGGYAPPVAPPPAAQPPVVQSYGSGYAASSGYAAGYGNSYQAGAYYYGAPTGTTVIITGAPTTTTTTVTEEVTYVRSAARKVVRRAPVRRKAVSCCKCVCR
jgi:Ni/Co efflux regulator RcnB